MTKAEGLVAAAFRGFAEALVAAEGSSAKKKDERPLVIPVDAVRAAVQEALPGIIQAMADDAGPAQERVDRPFGLGNIEDDLPPPDAGDRETYDPNLPGSGGWSRAPE